MTSLLSPSGQETVKTVKTTLEIELQRTETVTQITCSKCARTGEVRKVEFTPPASIGGSVASCRVPDGWWVQGATYFGMKGTCPDCFEKPFSGVDRSRDDDSHARNVQSRGVAALSSREEPLIPNVAVDSDRDGTGVAAWQSMLSTPGGASAVAKALAIHLRGTIMAAGPRETAETIRHVTSLPRIAETLEAASARLAEFKPKDAADVDLRPLGVQPFAELDHHLYCSFCGKAQRDVKKLIAGPGTYICDECVAFSQSIIDQDSPNPRIDLPAMGTDPDLLDRIERLCAKGGRIAVIGVERWNEPMARYATIRLTNEHGHELAARGDHSTTAADALRSVLEKVGL